ncbi:hypothetical protein FRB97_004689 [Tulasnella sp. 331]|nr:hypothetical protein FRB97_004689 [Tulasnella sp. 331]KAG8881259.1 hypothetical protein FRB98_004445 [Tulasnella sp. 332]
MTAALARGGVSTKCDASSLTPEAREFVEKYTRLSSDEATRHIVEVRDRAWDIEPYPCLGRFRFLTPGIAGSGLYPQILDRLKQGETLLDLGMCFGQDIRKLVSDGAPSENIYGSDLRPEYLELGYALFMDKDRLKSKLIAADIFDPSSELKQIEGKIDIIYTGSFFHLFDWDDQIRVAKRVVQILRPQKGSIVLGRQTGTMTAGPSTRRGGTQPIWRHDVDSFLRMWKQVGDETSTEWSVEAELHPIEINLVHPIPTGSDEEPRMRLRFSVHRI